MDARPIPAASFTAVLASALAALLLAVLPAPASAAPSCDRVASPQGSDSAPGTEVEPLRTARALAVALQPGQVGCLRTGTYAADNEVKISAAGTTLTSYPGERATLKARVYVPQGADAVTISDLNLDGRNATDLPSPTINADDVVLRDNDITNERTAICISVGSPTWGRADRTLIEGNKIHDCGKRPSTNFHHGIYVNSADDTVIRDNWIYDNADRGVQLYSDAQRTQIVGNVIDGNGEGIIFGGDDDSASSDNVVEHNVITNSTIRHNVESNWTGPIGTGNVVRDNCIGGGADASEGGGVLSGVVERLGFVASGNLNEAPEFANRSAGDLTIPASSPCAAILAGAAAPAQQTAASSEGEVTINASKKRVEELTPVLVKGMAQGAEVVTVLVRRHGHWHRLARQRTKHSGKYKARIRLRAAGTSRLKAMASGLQDSRAVRLRVKKR